ncbi:DASH family cryptochrome [Pantoea sp. 1.19]|uniref:DASH family cryptochrome n=1 Tax=Pantoea sp. 1.19 TaxID=1925589 RepID=UPI000948AB79|nr:DASH family cryptochrome [Pantoea sp. 1.19]
MTDTRLYLFTDDLRLADNPALTAACQEASALLPVCFAPAAPPLTRWGFTRTHPRRTRFQRQALADLDRALRERGSALRVLPAGNEAEALGDLLRQLGGGTIVAQAAATPEEAQRLQRLRDAGLPLNTHWQATLFSPARLPFSPDALPDQFTPFRQRLEKAAVRPAAPLPPPALPPWPSRLMPDAAPLPWPASAEGDARASFPAHLPTFYGGSAAAAGHLQRWFSDARARHYKATRNGLTGIDFSTKFSPWLAQGALSARQIYAACQRYHDEQGANEGTDWLIVELLWRDYFHILQRKYGVRLWQAGGLRGDEESRGDPAAFTAWCEARTGDPLVDAGMRELRTTGYLSNRMRQIVASALIYDGGGDWRAGAAWFEHHLIDFDPAVNQGNWLYIAGRGTDPRGGRHFNTQKQAEHYDSEGAYRALWRQD